ncbi:hypothetical protein BH23CHL2_BH23CHL2_09820 [soil metagenome]
MQYRDQQPDIRTFGRRHDGYDEQPTEPLPAFPPQRRRPERRGRGMKLVVWLMTVVAIAIVLVIGAMLASENIVKPMVGDRIERKLGAGVGSFVDQELAALPEPPANGSQQYLVSEAELNQRIREQQDLGPLDDATAEINDDGIVVHLEAYRMSGTYRAQVEAESGAVKIDDGTLSGPLSFFVPVEDLERAANEAILSSLAASNLQVTGVTLVEGEIVLTLEPTGAGNDIPSG